MGLCPLPNMGTNAQDGAAAGSQGGGLLGWFKGLLKGKDKDKAASPLKGNSRKRIVAADLGFPSGSQVSIYNCAWAKHAVIKSGITLRYIGLQLQAQGAAGSDRGARPSSPAQVT